MTTLPQFAKYPYNVLSYYNNQVWYEANGWLDQVRKLVEVPEVCKAPAAAGRFARSSYYVEADAACPLAPGLSRRVAPGWRSSSGRTRNPEVFV